MNSWEVHCKKHRNFSQSPPLVHTCTLVRNANNCVHVVFGIVRTLHHCPLKFLLLLIETTFTQNFII